MLPSDLTANDFPDLETLLHALNYFPLYRWKWVFALPEIESKLKFPSDPKDCKELWDILKSEDKREGLRLILLRIHNKEEIKSLLEAENRDWNIEDQWDEIAEILDEEFAQIITWQTLDNINEMKSLSPELTLAAHLSKIEPSKDRWLILAMFPEKLSVLTQCIAQGQGNKILETLDINEGFKSQRELVLKALQEGYKQFDEKEGCSSAQYKTFHFFHPVKEPRPFLEKLEQSLAQRKVGSCPS